MRSCSSLLFGKCGRHASKIISVVLSLLILFSCVISSNAAEIDGFYSENMTVTGVGRKYVDGQTVNEDYTSKITVSSSTYLNKACTLYTIPLDSSYSYRFVNAYQIENLNASHEYNLKFSWNAGLPSNTLFDVSLVFYDSSGTVLKEQILYNHSDAVAGWREVDIDFKPDASGLGGYKTKLEFTFLFTGSSIANFRLSEVIEFKDKDDNSNWFQRIINAIKELPSDFVNGIKSFFDNLGLKFENVGKSITDKFEEVKNSIGSWFTEIGDKLSNKFTEVGNAITSKFQEIGAEFSAIFEKFKPRLYEVFDWRYGWISDDGVEYFEEDTGQAVISQGFFIPSGSKYIFDVDYTDYIDNSDLEAFYVEIFYFDDNGVNYILSEDIYSFINNYSEGFELTSGLTYYFSLASFSDFSSLIGDLSLSDFCNSVVKVYADEGWLTAFGRMILNGLKNLFIPSSYFFETKKNELETFCVEHFGAVYQSIDLIIDIIKKFINISPTEPCITFPSIDIPLFNETYHISDEVVYSFSWINDKSHFLYYFYNFYRGFVTLLLSLSFANYCRNKYNEVFGGGSE